MIKKLASILILIIICLVIYKCGTDKTPKRTNPNEPIEEISKSTEINKINFYFENSLSMDGYLNGNNFQQAVRRILNNSENDSLITYFVNTKEYTQLNIKDKIANKNISSPGIENSDHKFIFKNAIKNATRNNLSIVITDGIYSMKDGNIALVEVDIEDAFKKALEENEIETVVLKMASDFIGTYYTESKDCKNKPINQTRPYYILLFGNKGVIDKTLKEIVIINDLEGYQEQARFMITKDLNVHYTVLTKGEEKKGSFEPSDHSNITKKIIKAKKFSKKGTLLSNTYLQFGIAVDYSNLRIPDSYLINKSNYTVEDNTGYHIEEIKKVEDLDKNSISYKWIDTQNKKDKFKYTHIIVVQGKSNLYNDLNLSLDINFPTVCHQTKLDFLIASI